MDSNWQPALPEQEPIPGGTDGATRGATPGPGTEAGAPEATIAPLSAPTPLGATGSAAPVKATGLRRIVATAALTVGLLAIGGVSAVMAASPAPSASTTPSTQQPSGVPGGAPNGAHSCPNMGTNGSGSGSGSSAPTSSSSG